MELSGIARNLDMGVLPGAMHLVIFERKPHLLIKIMSFELYLNS